MSANLFPQSVEQFILDNISSLQAENYKKREGVVSIADLGIKITNQIKRMFHFLNQEQQSAIAGYLLYHIVSVDFPLFKIPEWQTLDIMRFDTQLIHVGLKYADIQNADPKFLNQNEYKAIGISLYEGIITAKIPAMLAEHFLLPARIDIFNLSQTQPHRHPKIVEWEHKKRLSNYLKHLGHHIQPNNIIEDYIKIQKLWRTREQIAQSIKDGCLKNTEHYTLNNEIKGRFCIKRFYDNKGKVRKYYNLLPNDLEMYYMLVESTTKHYGQVIDLVLRNAFYNLSEDEILFLSQATLSQIDATEYVGINGGEEVNFMHFSPYRCKPHKLLMKEEMSVEARWYSIDFNGAHSAILREENLDRYCIEDNPFRDKHDGNAERLTFGPQILPLNPNKIINNLKSTSEPIDVFFDGVVKHFK